MGTSSNAQVKSDASVNIQSDKGYGRSLHTGLCMLAGIRLPSGLYNVHQRISTYIQDATGTPADFLKFLKMTIFY